MSRLTRFTQLGLALAISLLTGSDLVAAQYGIGETATSEQIAGWDIDVRPDGQGLPPGSGSVEDGTILYEEKCASCHGVFGEGAGRWPVLSGGFDTLTEDRPEKTVGSYWPFVSTLWDYIHRAMPFLEPQSLEDDEVYAVTAYVLYLNDLVNEEFVLDQDNLASIRLPNEQEFVDDPRPDVHNTLCMEKCRDPEEIAITWDSTELGVSPVDHLQDEEGGQSQQTTVAAAADVGKTTYQASCAVCHDNGVAGAPKAGVSADWNQRTAQGIEMLLEHAVNGYTGKKGYMPPKGGNPGLSDEEIKLSIEWMIGQSN